MKRPLRLPIGGRKSKILLGVAVGVALLLALFDANWLRPRLERHLSERSQRAVRIGSLEVLQRFSLEPTLRLRDVYIENASWADSKRPLAVAGEAAFTFALKTLLDERRVVTKVVLKDAEVDLEWLPDGLRNWRLREPDDRGTGKYKVLSVEAQRSSVRFVRRGIALDVIGVWTPAEPGESRAQPGPSLPSRVDFEGVYRGAAFAGTVVTSELLTIQETGASFPLRGHVSAGKTRFDADGTVADLLKLSAIDAKVAIAGPSLAKLQPFVNLHLASHAYRADARLRKTDNYYAIEQLQARIGASDVAGEFAYEQSGAEENSRSMLRASLRSESADLADFGLVGGADAKQSDSDRMFPRRALGAEPIRSIDARISVTARKLKSAALAALDSVKFSAELDDGVLKVTRIDLGVAGGHAVGAFTLDAQREPASARVALDFRGLRLERLLPNLESMGVSAGSASASVRMSGRGNSIAAIAGNATGSMALNMSGGRISNLLDAKLGLNLGKILRLTLSGDRAIEVRCAQIAFGFDNGLGRSRTILLDTEQTRIDGNGTMNLRDETLEVLLSPTQKKPGLFSLHSVIRVHGPLRHPVFALDKSAVAPTAADEKHVQCPET